MKCIKTKCQFYKEHNFKVSYFQCVVSHSTRSCHKSSDIDCVMTQERDRVKEYLKHLDEIIEQMEIV